MEPEHVRSLLFFCILPFLSPLKDSCAQDVGCRGPCLSNVSIAVDYPGPLCTGMSHSLSQPHIGVGRQLHVTSRKQAPLFPLPPVSWFPVECLGTGELVPLGC